MTITEAFEIAPTSEQTLRKHHYVYKGLAFINDMGYPCEYRIEQDGKELGMIKYYKGRILACYELRAA